MIALRPDDEIDGGRAPNDLGALGLGDAANDGDERGAPRGGALLFQLAHAAKLGIDLLGRLLADVAGVEYDEVGVLDARRLRIALLRERLRHALAVIDVHLAAVGLDEDLAAGARRRRAIGTLFVRVASFCQPVVHG